MAHGGFDADDPDVRVALLEVAANTGNRAAGTDARKKNVNPAAGLSPDFRAGRMVMSGDVQRTLILVGADILAVEGLAFDHALDDSARPFRRKDRAQFILYFDQFGAQKSQ
jgi:hypothetical protein